MSKKSKCVCNPQKDQMIQDVIEVLEREVSNYSSEFVPERITRIRAYIEKLNNSSCP